MVNFKGAHFQKELILTCVRWNVAYPLSYRHLEKMMEEHRVLVDHSTIKMDGKEFSEQYVAYLRVFALYDSWVGELLKLFLYVNQRALVRFCYCGN